MALRRLKTTHRRTFCLANVISCSLVIATRETVSNHQFAIQSFLGVVYAFINHCIESGKPQRVNLMLRNEIVDAALNESVLMVESVNTNNNTRWFHGISASQWLF